MKNRYKYVFAVLTYRNSVDVLDLIASIKEKVEDYKIIIVNNFYDEESEKEIKKIADENSCDFISSENLGYSVGNHKAIRFAKENYDFDYVIVANPDTIIKKFDEKLMAKAPYGVIAPQIISKSGRNQNPMVAYNSKFACKMLYKGIKDDKKFAFNVGRIINKGLSIFKKIIKALTFRKFIKIYQPHGSFMMIPSRVIDAIGMPFDENLFLFAEEGVIAWKLKRKNIPVYYTAEVSVYHKEDGSMQFRSDISQRCKEASIYFYENYTFKK